MSHVIAAPCIGTKDRSCSEACPVDCIVDVGDQLAIDPTRCVDCGACVPACPVSAIFSESRLPTEWLGFRDRNAQATRSRAARFLRQVTTS